MNVELQEIFSRWYRPELLQNSVDGASSVAGTTQLRFRIVELFQRYNITSIFDAGCNDCGWMSLVMPYVRYHGGDISRHLVKDLQQRKPELDIVLHDITTDTIPAVDLLFVRDVAIHLNNKDKLQMWKNWISSEVPWILTTHIRDVDKNIDFEYSDNFPFSAMNWELEPWNFPAPADAIDEYGPGGRCLALWHRDQFKGLI